jgi:dienelactone hydrolase
MSVSRREFCEWLGRAGVLASTAGVFAENSARDVQPAAPQSSSHIGSLYPFVQKQVDRSSLELSFLNAKVRDLGAWQKQARSTVFDHLFYAPPQVASQPEIIRRTDRADYVEEYLTFQATPDIRVPAYVLIPKKVKLPAPGIVVLHDHGGFYLWGKEKVVEVEGEHAALTAFKKQYYSGKSIASEVARRGYVVIAIDMFYWGERRMLLDDDPALYRNPRQMTNDDVAAFNRRSGQSEQLVARSLFTAGITWPGVMLWDDIRTLDYLARRPEVDRRRLGCVGLSVGGYRSFVLSALDPRIKVAVDVGWMSSLGAHVQRHVTNTIGFSFHIIGLYRYLDFPDLAALIAPRSVLVINGSKDQLFPLDAVKAAFSKIERCFRKAGAPDHQRCRFYDAPHQFNAEMQVEAWEWLERWI